MKNFIKTIFNAFVGVVNNKSLWEIGPAYRSLHGKKRQMVELYKATNFDITNDLKLKKRPGKTLLISGVFSDLWTDGTNLYCIKNGSLVSLGSNLLTTTTLKASVSSPVCFTKAGLDVVWADGTYIEYIADGGSHAFTAPTDENKTAIPVGDLVEWFFGKLLIAKGRNIYQTDPLVRRKAAIDFTMGNNRQMASDIQLLRTVDDGLWISDETNIYFAQGSNLNEMTPVSMANYPTKFNAAIKVDGTLFPFRNPIIGTCHIAATSEGLVLLGNNGLFKNLTEKDYEMLSGDNIAIMFKQTSSLSQIIASIKE